MSNVPAKRHESKHGGKPQSNKKNDIVYYAAALAVVVVALIFVPKVLGAVGVSFLAAGAGLNKLFSVVAAAGLGWLCLMPSQGYKDFVELSKGARTEWRKTVKPDRDTVMRTTLMVLAIVAMFALLILFLDWVFGSILRAFVG